MNARISNGSASAHVAGYGIVPDSGLVVWLDLAPQHPKIVGAVRAEMTSNTRSYMRLTGDGLNETVCGLGRGYLTFTADAPLMATGPFSKAQHLRMVAPEAVRPENVDDAFYVFAWPQAGITAATALAAMLERYSPYPMLLEWGEYLLHAVTQKHDVEPLITGGSVPAGCSFPGGIPWGKLISDGLKNNQIKLSC